MKRLDKLKELRSLSDKELEARVRELREEVFHLRIKRTTSQLEKPHLIGVCRQDIARCLTILTERRLQAEKASAQTSAQK